MILNFSSKHIRRVLFLIGANGAGKTTTFRMLINDVKPTSGKIIINGYDINKMVNSSFIRV